MFIAEIFASVQGEGHYLGVPAVFVRTMGCNLKCSFCDTKSTWINAQSGAARALSVAKVVSAVNYAADAARESSTIKAELGRTIQLVVLTGGEPCLQEDLHALIDALHGEHYIVAIETNGTLATPLNADWVTCSPKGDANYMINESCLPDELKYVVTEDFDEKVITESIRDRFLGNIWLQPDGYHMQPTWEKCFAIAQSDSRLRVGVQLQKLMEVR